LPDGKGPGGLPIEPLSGGSDAAARAIGPPAADQPVEPIGPEGFGLPGASIEEPGAYQGGSPVGGPASLFNIGGAPIALLGGVFSGGLPLGGPVTQAFRSGGPVPPTLFAITLESSGPIGAFFIGQSGDPIEGRIAGERFPGGPGEHGEPIGGEF
jgi:hypothetical protein